MDSSRHIFKRVKERSIMEAKQSVDQWRNLFKNGEIDHKGNKIKYSLKQAAEKVGVPKKTLEDYHQLLKKAEQMMDLSQIGDKKMGYLRGILKQQTQQQIQQQGVFSDEELEDNTEVKIEEDQIATEDMIIEGEIEAQYDQESFYYQFQQVSLVFIPQEVILTPIQKKIEYNEYDQYNEELDTDDEYE